MDVLEVEHLIADDDRLAVRRRLEDVVPAVRNEAATDVDDIAQPIDAPELADRIEDHNVLAALCALLQTLARRDGKARLAAEMLNLDRAQHLARRNDKPHIRILGTHGGKCSEYELLFTAMRRARNHDVTCPRKPEFPDERSTLFGADARIRLIEFRIARHRDELARRTETHDVIRIDARLHGEAFHSPDHLTQHSHQVLVLLHTAVTDAPVDHHDGYVELLCLLQEVRPELRLHGQENARTDAPHDA